MNIVNISVSDFRLFQEIEAMSLCNALHRKEEKTANRHFIDKNKILLSTENLNCVKYPTL